MIFNFEILDPVGSRFCLFHAPYSKAWFSALIVPNLILHSPCLPTQLSRPCFIPLSPCFISTSPMLYPIIPVLHLPVSYGLSPTVYLHYPHLTLRHPSCHHLYLLTPSPQCPCFIPLSPYFLIPSLMLCPLLRVLHLPHHPCYISFALHFAHIPIVQSLPPMLYPSSLLLLVPMCWSSALAPCFISCCFFLLSRFAAYC